MAGGTAGADEDPEHALPSGDGVGECDAEERRAFFQAERPARGAMARRHLAADHLPVRKSAPIGVEAHPVAGDQRAMRPGLAAALLHAGTRSSRRRSERTSMPSSLDWSCSDQTNCHAGRPHVLALDQRAISGSCSPCRRIQ